MKMLLITIACFVTPLMTEGQSEIPIGECKVLNCLKTPPVGGSASICNVANGEHVNLEIFVKGGAPHLKNAGPNMINPDPVPEHGIYYLVKVIRQVDGVEVPARCNDTGGGGDNSTFSQRISLQIPETQAIRRSKVETYWKGLKKEANAEERAIMKQTAPPDENVFRAVEEALVENQLGAFKIICTYVSTAADTWNGRIEAPPVLINVVNTGTLLDKRKR